MLKSRHAVFSGLEKVDMDTGFPISLISAFRCTYDCTALRLDRYSQCRENQRMVLQGAIVTELSLSTIAS